MFAEAAGAVPKASTLEWPLGGNIPAWHVRRSEFVVCQVNFRSARIAIVTLLTGLYTQSSLFERIPCRN